MSKVVLNKNASLCACGCRAFVNKIYLKGHCHRGIARFEEIKRKLFIAMKGRIISEEQKKQISRTLKNYVFTEEHKKNLTKAQMGRKSFRKQS